jgi:hypothetical protein
LPARVPRPARTACIQGVSIRMKELLRSVDPVLVSFATSLLADAGIDFVLLDRNMSILEGSLGILPQRIMVGEEQLAAARALLGAADIDCRAT